MKHSTFIQHQAKYILCTLAMLVSFVGTAWGDDATIGNTDNTSIWWTAFSDYTTLEKGKTIRFSFNNFGEGTDNWANWDLVAANSKREENGYTEYFVLRADKYGWGTYYNGDGFSLTGKEDGYYKALHGTYGARVYMTVTFTTDSKIKVIAQTTENDAKGNLTGNTYTYTFTSKALPNDVSEIKLFHVADHCHIEDYTVSGPYDATQAHTINFDADHGTGATMPDPVSLYEGYTYVFPDLDPKPTKFGQTFYGWNDGNVWKAVGYQYTMGSKDVTLKASYYVNHTNSVNFNSNDAIIGTLKEPISGQSILLPAGYSSYEDITSSTSWTGTQGTETSTSYSGISGYQALYYNKPTTGDVMHQELTGLANGTYEVIMSVAASYTQSNGITGGQAGNNLTYAFAGEKEISIPVLDRTWVNSGDQNIVALIAEVTDGTLNFGLRSKTASGNWYVIKVESLRRITDTGGFTGWYNGSGTRVGGAGDSYSIQNDGETLYAHWAIGRTIEYNTSSKYVYSNAGNDKITVSQEDGTEYTANGKAVYYKTTSGTNINDKCYLNKSRTTGDYVTGYDPNTYVGAKFEIAEDYILKATAVNVRLAVGENFVYRVVINNGTEDVYTSSDDITISNFSKTSATNLDFTAALSNLTLYEGSSYVRVYYWLPGSSSNKYLAPLEISIEGTVEERPKAPLTTFAWSKASDEITRGGEFASPTFSATDATTTYSKENNNLTTVATFASDNEAVAAVANDGTVTLAGGLGTAKITATVTKDYKTENSPASYTIKVNPAPHHVTYNINGATSETPTQDEDIYEGETFTTAKAPELFGYTFKGWKSNITETIYGAAEEVTMGTEDIVLTAQWGIDRTSKKVLFNANNSDNYTPFATTLASLANNNKAIREPYPGQSVILPAGYSASEDVNQGTWKKSDGNNANTIPGDAADKTYYEFYSTGPTSAGAKPMSQTLSVANGTYEITLSVAASYAANGGVLTCPTGNGLTSAFAQDKEISIPVIKRTYVTAGDEITVAFTVDVTDNTLTYGLKNDATSGNWFIAKVLSLKKITNARLFKGWYTTADESGSLVGKAGDSYTIKTDGETLYAHWVTDKFTVTFDGNGGTASSATLTETTAGGGVTLPTASLSGYTFEGWTTTKQNANATGVDFLAAGSTYYPTENCTLYAYYITSGSYIYKINAKDASGNLLKTLKTGVASANVTEYFPKAFELNGKYYVTSVTTYSCDLSSTAPIKEITYTLDNRMVVYYEVNTPQVAETSKGVPSAYDSNLLEENNKNYSNGNYGNITSRKYTTRGINLGSLLPGKYVFSASAVANGFRNLAIRDITGKSVTETAEPIVSITGNGNPSENFTITKDTKILLNGKNADYPTSNQSADFDYAYISHADGIVFTEQPVGTNCLIGDVVTLRASAVAFYGDEGGYVTPTYKWAKYVNNGWVDIDGANGTTYTPPTTTDGTTTYICVATYGNNYVASNTVTIEVNQASFDPMDVTVALTDWDPVEPTFTNPYSSSITSWSSEDESIARVDASGNITMIKDGTTKIKAALANGRTVFYNLTITGKPGSLDFNTANTGKMSVEGKIMEQPINEVNNISLSIGNESEAAVIRKWHTTDTKMSLVINSLTGTDYPTIGADGIPTNGTFYKFTPSATGKLTLIGYGSEANTAVTIKYKDSNGAVQTLETTTNKEINYTSSGSISANITSGTTYYVTTDASHTFYLFSYEFSANCIFADKSVKETGTTYTQLPTVNGTLLTDGSGFTWSVIPKGDLATVKDKVTVNNGLVSWPADYGGAIVVSAKQGTYDIHYVITVPYKTHTWTFAADQWADMKANTDQFSTTYKVRTYNAARELTYINVPVISNAVAVDGDNAYFMSSTAGLWMTSGAKYFGSEAVMTDDGTMSLTDKLNRPYTDATGANYLTMSRSTLTIPNLKKGQYIRIRWKRYSNNSGDNMLASNVTDLDGTLISGNFFVGNYPSKSSEIAYDEFIVADDGDVSFTNNSDAGADGGWTHISSIDVSDTYLDTDYRVIDTDQNVYATTTEDGETKYPDLYIPQSTGTLTKTFNTVYGRVRCMSALTTKYYAEGVTDHKRGITVSMTEDGNMTVNAVKNGQIEVTMKGNSNGYVLDIHKQIFNVHVVGDAWIEQTFTQQYPFSWDFENVSNETFTKLQEAADVPYDRIPLNQWTTWYNYNEESDPYYSNRIVDDFIEGAALSISTEESYERLEEFQGLGVKAYKDNQIKISSSGKGLEFDKNGAEEAPSIVIPTVLEGYKVYVRGRWIDDENGVFKVSDPTDNSHTLTVTKMFDSNFGDDNEQIYVISGCNGNDIEVAIDGFQIRKIGVTTTSKKFQEWDGASYATDCEDYNVKYDLSGYFTNGLYPVTASIVSSTSGKIANFSSVKIAPEGTGTILKCASTNAEGSDNKAGVKMGSVPLFVRDVNSQEDDVANNMLVGVLEDTEIEATSSHKLYIFTRTYYDTTIGDDGKETVVPGSESKHLGSLGFYRLYYGQKSTIGGHKAYLNMGDTSNAKKVYYIWEMFDDEEANDISHVNINYEDGAIYNLQGVRVTNPNKGIYIVNGKKVVIK